MNLSPLLAAALSAEGHEARHWMTVGALNAPDAEIMAWAAQHSHVVITCDLDFGHILGASGADGPSVIQLRAARLSTEAVAALIAVAVRDQADDLDAGCLLTLDTVRHRVRLLPIRRPGNNSAS